MITTCPLIIKYHNGFIKKNSQHWLTVIITHTLTHGRFQEPSTDGYSWSRNGCLYLTFLFCPKESCLNGRVSCFWIQNLGLQDTVHVFFSNKPITKTITSGWPSVLSLFIHILIYLKKNNISSVFVVSFGNCIYPNIFMVCVCYNTVHCMLGLSCCYREFLPWQTSILQGDLQKYRIGFN